VNAQFLVPPYSHRRSEPGQKGLKVSKKDDFKKKTVQGRTTQGHELVTGKTSLSSKELIVERQTRTTKAD
jgi:hypothetical protein